MSTSNLLFSSIQAQLWRYYDLEFDIDKIEETEPIPGVEEAYKSYELIGSTGETAMAKIYIKCKMFETTVEDLYLWKCGNWIEPTTTLAQQEER